MTDVHRIDEKYTPIDCGRYDAYELAIMHRSRGRLTWPDADGTVCSELLAPTDLQTRDGKEFLETTAADGSVREIRLDRIVSYLPA